MNLQNIDWKRINSILNSKAAENAMGMAGAFLKSKGGNDRADRQNAMSNAQFKAKLLQDNSQFGAEMAMRLAESVRGEDLTRAVQAMNASKLGENENFATRNRILSAVLPQMKAGNVRPTDPAVAAAMPTGRGTPFADGIPAELLQAINEKATASAIAGRNKQLLNIDPNASLPDFEAMGFDPEMGDFGLPQHRQGVLDAQSEGRTAMEETLRRALAQDYEGIMALPDQDPQQKKAGLWSKIGGVLKFAAPIAASFIPGIGPVAAAALAGGGSAGGTLLQGGGVKDAIASGLLGAASGYGAKKLPSGGPKLPQGFSYARPTFP